MSILKRFLFHALHAILKMVNLGQGKDLMHDNPLPPSSFCDLLWYIVSYKLKQNQRRLARAHTHTHKQLRISMPRGDPK